MLSGNQALAEQVITESNNPLQTFVTLLVQEQHQQEQQAREERREAREQDKEKDMGGKRSDDIVIDGDTCRP